MCWAEGSPDILTMNTDPTPMPVESRFINHDDDVKSWTRFVPQPDLHSQTSFPPAIYSWNKQSTPFGPPIYYWTQVDPVKGLKEIRGEPFDTIRETVAKMFNPEWATKCKLLGCPPRAGALFHGPPGTGKTKQVSMAIQSALNRGDIKAAFLIDYPGQLDTLLEAAEYLPRPFAVVIDELYDFCGGDEWDGNNPNAISVLKRMDGTKDMEGVFILACTNNFKDIPDVLLRPGRFSYQVEVGPCSPEAAENYVHLVLDDAGGRLVVPAENQASLKEAMDGKTVDELRFALLENVNLVGSPDTITPSPVVELEPSSNTPGDLTALIPGVNITT